MKRRCLFLPVESKCDKTENGVWCEEASRDHRGTPCEPFVFSGDHPGLQRLFLSLGDLKDLDSSLHILAFIHSPTRKHCGSTSLQKLPTNQN